jgi:hypothetical protein
VRIVSAVETCAACPSQWDAVTDQGVNLYLRYRFGHGTVQIDGPENEPIAEFEHGNSMDGDISLEEFCELAGLDVQL